MLTPEYASVLAALKTRIRAAQLEAARASNRVLLELYWYMGETIVRMKQLLELYADTAILPPAVAELG